MIVNIQAGSDTIMVVASVKPALAICQPISSDAETALRESVIDVVTIAFEKT